MREIEIPSIIIKHNADFKQDSVIINICYGIEEEGIPWKVLKDNETSSIKLSHSAAMQSKLSVGIGIGADEIVTLHYASLKENQPLSARHAFEDEGTLKDIGANAARLVKGDPLKNWK